MTSRSGYSRDPGSRAARGLAERRLEGSASSRCAAPSLRYGPSGDALPSRRRSAAMGRKQASGPTADSSTRSSERCSRASKFTFLVLGLLTGFCGSKLYKVGSRQKVKAAGSYPCSPYISCKWAGLKRNLLIHESPLTDALFLLVSKSDEVTTT